MKTTFLIYLLNYIFGALGAMIIANYGASWHLLDLPTKRSSHSNAVPRGGGIGILFAFIVAALNVSVPSLFWIPAVLLSLLSLWGDTLELSPKMRLFVQFFMSLLLLYSLFRGNPLQFTTCLAIILFSIFMVGTANFYNFMDGINGIAGITGVIAFGLLAYVAMTSNADHAFASLAVALACACLGFLPFNFPKAFVFMGDVGSILLGFIFAGMVVHLSQTWLDFLCLTSFLLPFYADELTTMSIRINDGENLTIPHRRHLYQLLANEFGVAHWKISMAYGTAQLLIGVSLLAVRHVGRLMLLFLLMIYSIGFTVLTGIMRHKLHERDASPH